MMNDNRDFLPPSPEPEAMPDSGADPVPTAVPEPVPDAPPLTSGADALFMPPPPADADAAPDADAAADTDDAAFSYDQFSSAATALFPTADGLDLDAALASLSVTTPASDQPEAPPYVPPRYEPRLPRPAIVRLQRGSPLSIVPAVALIAFGVWLTVQTTTGAALDSRLIAAIAAGGLALLLLIAWLATGRWGRGLLLAALLIAAIGGVTAAGVLPVAAAQPALDLTRAYPLYLVGIGLAALLTGLLGRPLERRWVAFGALIALAGGLGTLLTSGLIAPVALTTAAPLWPIVAVILAAVWLAPLLARRRGRAR